jgi:hypothetical protein
VPRPEWLEYAAVFRRPIVLAALVPALLAIGCGGGGDDNSGSPGNELSANDQLTVLQAHYDIDEFCTLSRAPRNSDLYIRGLSGAIDAGNDLVAITKKEGDKVFAAKALKIKAPMRKVTEREIARLENKCGRDGKVLAAKMRRAVSS